MKFQVKVDSRPLLAALDKFPKLLLENVILALLTSSRNIQTLSRQEHEFTTRTGSTERSVDFEIDRTMLQSRIGIDAGISPHGVGVHDGTPPHIIRPKTKKVLRWAKGKRFIFAKKVHHPGTKPDPFIVNAGRRLENQFKKNVDRAIVNAAKGAGL